MLLWLICGAVLLFESNDQRKEDITMERILLPIVMFGGSIALVGGNNFPGKICGEKKKGSIDGVGHRDGASVFGCAG